MAIKKAYQEIIDVLEASPTVRVSEVLPQIIELASAKRSGSTSGSSFIKDNEGNVVAILDYYFKRWMPIVGDACVEFGAKATSATGLNSMCKVGVSAWTKQQREAKVATAGLIDKLESGEIEASDIADERAQIEEARGQIIETELGFADKADLLTYLDAEGYVISDVAYSVETE